MKYWEKNPSLCWTMALFRVVDYMGNRFFHCFRLHGSPMARETKKVRQDRGLIRYLMRASTHHTFLKMCENQTACASPRWTAGDSGFRHRTANVNELLHPLFQFAIDGHPSKTAPDAWRIQATGKQTRQ